MSQPPINELLDEISSLADQLSITIDDRFDITLTTDQSDERLLKLVMMINFLLERARDNISHLASVKESLEEKVKERTALLELVIRGTNDGIWFWHIPENRMEVSERFAQLSNQTVDSIENLQSWINLIHKDDQTRFSDHIRRFMNGVTRRLDCRYRINDGQNQYRWVVMRGAMQRDGQGNPLLLAGTQADITQLIAVDQESSMPNDLAFNEWIKGKLDGDSACSLVAIASIDHFSELANSLTVEQLKQFKYRIKEKIQKALPFSAFIAKLSNETFGIGLYEPIKLSTSILKNLFNAFDTAIEITGYGPLKLTLSIGTLELPCSMTSAYSDDYLSALWIALRKAQESAGNSLVRFDQKLLEEQKNRLSIKSEVNLALEEKRVIAFMQPILDAKTYKVSSFEALVRIQNPDGSFLPPGQFIPIVENTELIIPLTNSVLSQALSHLKRFIDTKLVLPDTSVAVNIAPHHLLSGELAELVANELEAVKLPYSALKLEVTETALVENLDLAVEQLNKLRKMGCKIALDDFGTGYSSLEYLNTLPIDVLKLDRVFVQKMTVSKKTAAIAHTVCSLASILDLEVVAEGVEEVHEVEMLGNMGATLFQGFYFCKPLMPAELTSWLKISLEEGLRDRYRQK